MNMRAQRLVLGGVLSAIVATGSACSSGPWTPEGIDGRSDGDRPQVSLLDRELTGVIQVDPELDWTKDGRLWARSRIRNSSGDALQIQVRTSFKDKRGNPLDESSEWRVYLIGPYETLSYSYEALSAEAQDYLTQIRVAPSA